jgi:triosephosphate isomerase
MQKIYGGFFMSNCKIKAPFFEIGPKSYLYGDDILELALAADAASQKYDVDVIFTCPVVDIRRVAEATKRLHVFAPHMDPIYPGRGLADTLPESLVAAGAEGVMLNHVEKPLSFEVLAETIKRADEVGLTTIVCADSMADASKIATLHPDIIVAEPSELIGTGVASDMGYVVDTIEAVRKINPDIMVLQGAGISGADDVANVIRAGAQATGCTSGIIKADDPEAAAEEMLWALRKTWDEVHGK